MPTTVNGIGTMYYGKSNRHTRFGTCQHCQRASTLESYDTRLWFVVLALPIVPLGRKRILDACSYCRRHYVMSSDEYQATSQKSVAEALAQYEQEPTAANALQAHARMLAFHDYPAADSLRSRAISYFPKDAEMLVGFAGQLDYYSQTDEAGQLYSEAYRLQPDLPAARIGVAHLLMRADKLDEARLLLDFLEKPGAGKEHALGDLEILATKFQNKGRHDEALQLFRHLLTEFPDVMKHREFRHKIAVSERKLGVSESMLPGKQKGGLAPLNPWNDRYSGGQRTLLLAGLIAAAVIGGLLLTNEYIRRHRTLHLLSGLPAPVTVQIDNKQTMQVKLHDQIKLPEGIHRIEVTEPIKAEYIITMTSSYLDRFFKRPLWGINVAGTSPVIKTEATYAQDPQPSHTTLLAGQTHLDFPHIDYHFSDMPSSMKVSRGTGQITKTSITVVPIDPRSIIENIALPDAAFKFLEAHLQMKPDDSELLGKYVEVAQQHHAEARAEAFLKAGLERRPVEVHRHGTYLELMIRQGKLPQMIAEYDAALKSDPKNSALNYLRSRIEVDHAASQKLLKQAIAADPESPWPWHSLMEGHIARGDWTSAKQTLGEAERRQLDGGLTMHPWHLIQLGMGDREAILERNRAILAREPLALHSLIYLIDALVAGNQPLEARREFNEWKNKYQQQIGNPQLIELIENSMCYIIGDFATLEKLAANKASTTSANRKIDLWMATGQPEKILAAPDLSKELADPWAQLALAVALQMSGRNAEAAAWCGKAIDGVKSASLPEQLAGKMLAAKDPPPAEHVTNLTLETNQKLLLLCALADKFPTLAPHCRALAHKLNVTAARPYQLIKRYLAKSSART